MTERRLILMNPGPVNVDERVRQALAGPDMCHRELEFSELMTAVRRKLAAVCGGDDSYTSVVFTGSGTAALEATISSAVPPDGKLLVPSNGHYAERLVEIARVHRIATTVVEHGWSAPLDMSRIDAALAADPAISHVAVIHHETSTGMLNPVGEIGGIVHRHGRSLIVDAISSLGGEALDVRSDHVEWCVGTANKCLEGMPGLSFVCAPTTAVEALRGRAPRTLYLDVYGQYVAQEQNRAPAFTPAVPAFLALDTALDLLAEETVAGRTARYSRLAHRLRAGLEQAGLRLLLPPEQRCGTLTAIYLPEGVTYGRLHDALRARGFVIYAAQEALRHQVFRLANMGQITEADIDRFLAALHEALAELGRPGS